MINFIDNISNNYFDIDTLEINIKDKVNYTLHHYSNAIQEIEERGDAGKLFLMQSEIAEILKHYLLFLRNTLFELQKVNIKLHSDEIISEDSDKFRGETIISLQNVTTEFNQQVIEKNSWLDEAGNRGQLKHTFSLQNNPWNEYRYQFDILKAQVQDIYRQNTLIESLDKEFEVFAREINSKLNWKKEISENLMHVMEDLREKMQNSKLASAEFTKSMKEIDALMQKNSQNQFWKNSLQTHASELPDVNLITGYQNGMLIQRSIPLPQSCARWIDIKVIPRVTEVQEKVQTALESTKNTIKNSENKYGMITSDNEDKFRKTILDTLEASIKYLENFQSTIVEEAEDIKQKVAHTLTTSELISNANWLNVSYQDTFNQFRSETESIYSIITSRFINGYNFISKFIKSKRFQRTLSEDEAIVGFIKSKTQNNNIDIYDQIFINKDFLSDYYLINRDEVQDKMDFVMDLCENDFGVSILLTGSPLCGKSTFAKQIANKYWPKNHLFLYADSIHTLAGRKFTTDYNIADALAEVTKSIGTEQRLCLILDDLFNWRSKEKDLLDNLSALIAFVRKSKFNIVTICTVDPKLLDRANMFLGFEDSFMVKMNLSKIPVEQFSEAVIIRHEATQKNIVDSKGEILPPAKIKKIAANVLKKNSFNIGAGLLDWTSGTYIMEDGNIAFKNIDDPLPYMLDDENIYLFNYLLMNRSASEIELFASFDQMDQNRVRNLVYKYLKSKVLIRNEKGRLEINPILSSHIYNQYEALEIESMHHYLLESNDIEEDLQKQVDHTKKYLFVYPFHGDNGKVHIRKRRSRIAIDAFTAEKPAEILEYLNEKSEKIHFKFVKKITT